VEGVEVEGSVLTLSSEIPMARLIKELDGQLDRISSIGRIQPRLRDVLRFMLRGSGEEE
jgi:hypothetical protein